MRVESAVQLLGVRHPFTTFTKDVEASYRKLARRLHPDKGGTHECFLLLQEARDICLGLVEASLLATLNDHSCAQLCTDGRVRSIHQEMNPGGCDERQRVADAKVEVARLTFIGNMRYEERPEPDEDWSGHEPYEDWSGQEEAEARWRDDLERHRQDLEWLWREHRAQVERQRRELERQRREVERRRIELELERQRIEEERLQREAAEAMRKDELERRIQHFKPYMPRTWPKLNDVQVKKKTGFLKRLRSLRAMRKRAQDLGRDASLYNDKIDDVFREAWELHSMASPADQ